MQTSAKMGWRREISCMREMADALWERHTLLKTGHTHTHRQTKVKTVYPPVSLRSLGGRNKAVVDSRLRSRSSTHDEYLGLILLKSFSKIWLESNRWYRFRRLCYSYDGVYDAYGKVANDS